MVDLSNNLLVHPPFGMHYTIRWDPFFNDYMTLEDVYRYPGQHFAFHARQLTLNSAAH